VAHLIALYGEEETLRLPLKLLRETSERDVRLISRLLEHGLNTPPTSSAGRLFDAVAALAGVPGSRRTTYEGQAAVELELAIREESGRGYPFELLDSPEGWMIGTEGTIRGVVDDLLAGSGAAEISARFHRTVAEMVVAGCERVRDAGEARAVALSGGTFQNVLLLEQTSELLEEQGFTIYRHRRVPANDGGIALGQAVLADSVLKRKGI
jgi:hydrogenase maturation protein HypF